MWIKWWKHKEVLQFLASLFITMAVCFVTAYWQQNMVGFALVVAELIIAGFPIRKYGKKVLDLIAENM